MKTKQPKRIKVWVNDYGEVTGQMHKSRSDAERLAWSIAARVAVPLIEIRRGEVVVDVEALVAVYFQPGVWWPPTAKNALRAALKNVGVR